MFDNIVLRDLSVPVRQRHHKWCGPYTWTPSKSGTGVAFYAASKGLAMGRTGSRLDLRLEYANDYLASHLRCINGYYVDQCETLVPIVARLPKSRGFLAGWTYGKGCISELDGGIHDTIEDAAICAHDEAERAAERWREDNAKAVMEDAEQEHWEEDT